MYPYSKAEAARLVEAVKVAQSGDRRRTVCVRQKRLELQISLILPVLNRREIWRELSTILLFRFESHAATGYLFIYLFIFGLRERNIFASGRRRLRVAAASRT